MATDRAGRVDGPKIRSQSFPMWGHEPAGGTKDGVPRGELKKVGLGESKSAGRVP